MLTIRFTRKGKKNQPFFRMVVCDKKNSAKAGKSLEILGNYNPITKEKGIKKERVEHWLKVGAQPSDRVHNFLISEGVIKGEKIAVHAKSKKKEGETEEKTAPPETPEAKPAE
ncbi:30S ribosomal protein S16 [bacterium (Candidatus Gribaldobacteria) CG23_combo_of_CG06-09_8_20_14_all_37_87_8]|uniref:Small ribosomal subunit protein bS16 n=2 Tax=Candidatus Gribaldobacteria TaxID=2798536 RepID=A0A2G9ZF35_9BACT|nr:MAG: 30S ribosomal protein S16 [Parcubacteria group bacterium CG1_02_37_13]PIP31789.1 MAG: 30S ribosomal protein S16 [bacterium (Candidatus Gribaldobacteria) CG23_combo_of_CG06-09_8_20_14_all_37_87_8]PIR90392.1 MAG: 30S ribosomal protein S16 [bacterium (Candidatus Gribaldobacteria) CG10_big_fil_rev_8_21_14_0_10_37_21]